MKYDVRNKDDREEDLIHPEDEFAIDEMQEVPCATIDWGNPNTIEIDPSQLTLRKGHQNATH